jgi:hypothetical protein
MNANRPGQVDEVLVLCAQLVTNVTVPAAENPDSDLRSALRVNLAPGYQAEPGFLPCRAYDVEYRSLTRRSGVSFHASMAGDRASQYRSSLPQIRFWSHIHTIPICSQLCETIASV